MARHDFRDPNGDLEDLVLVIDETLVGEHGVEHPGCSSLAVIAIDLDAWQCSGCGRRGRVSGAWAMERWRAEAPEAIDL